jgi:hypothetical protein
MNDALEFLIIFAVVALIGFGLRAAWRRWRLFR